MPKINNKNKTSKSCIYPKSRRQNRHRNTPNYNFKYKPFGLSKSNLENQVQ